MPIPLSNLMPGIDITLFLIFVVNKMDGKFLHPHVTSISLTFLSYVTYFYRKILVAKVHFEGEVHIRFHIHFYKSHVH